MKVRRSYRPWQSTHGRLDRMQSELSARLDRMQADLSMFYRILGEHGADIDHLKKNRPA